jgi:hypothetical protein
MLVMMNIKHPPPFIVYSRYILDFAEFFITMDVGTIQAAIKQIKRPIFAFWDTPLVVKLKPVMHIEYMGNLSVDVLAHELGALVRHSPISVSSYLSCVHVGCYGVATDAIAVAHPNTILFVPG